MAREKNNTSAENKETPSIYPGVGANKAGG
jgi:hypothetical protein